MSTWKPSSWTPSAETPANTAPSGGYRPKSWAAVAPAAPTEGESAVRGLIQGSGLGLADEWFGGFAVADQALREGRLGEFIREPAKAVETYRNVRDAHRGLASAAEEENPKAYMTGALVGSAPTVLSPAGAGGQALGLAAGVGAVQGYGASTEEHPARAGADALTGAALGLGGQYVGTRVGETMPAAASWLADKASDFAERRAVKALIGQNKAAFKDLNAWDKLNALGRELLDRGIVRAGASLDDIVEGASTQKELAGEAQGAALDALDALPGRKVNLQQMADRMEEEVLAPLLRKPAMRQEAARMAEEIQAIRQRAAEEFAATGRPEVLFSVADADFKRPLQARAKFDKDTPATLAEQFQKLYGVANDEIETAAARAARKAGAPEIAGDFEEAKRLFGLFAPGGKAGEALQAARESNRWTSPSDYGVALAGGIGTLLSGGNPLTGVGAGAALSVAHKLLRERGPQVVADLSNRLSHADWLNAIATSNPALLGKWGARLSRAAAQSPEALAMAHHLLAQEDPAYQAHLQALANGTTPSTPQQGSE